VTPGVVIAGAERLGDLLFATGPLRLLRAARPDLAVAVLTAPGPAALLAGNPHVARVFAVPRRAGAVGRLIYARRAARALGTLGRDLTILALRDRPVYRALARRSGSRYLARDILDAEAAGHSSRRVAWALVPLGLELPDGPVRPEIYLGPEDHDAAARALVEIGAEAAHPLVLLQPCSRDARLFARRTAPREWPAERFAELAAALAELGARVLVHADRLAERLRARRIRARSGGAATVLPRLPLRALAALCARADLVVSVDTGPLHVANAVGAPVLAILGPTDPALTGPVGPPERVAVVAPPRPGPCDAPVAAVLEAARTLLAPRAS
jgi:ADP-heptose:LPS heptosyltransferase